MDACKCPITNEIFEDPVVGDDGHTYERKAIIDWLTKNATSPMTREPMDINSLRTNYIVKKMIEELRSTEQLQQTQNQFQLDVDIRKTRPRPLFQGFGKSIYEVEWINRNGPPIILLKIEGAKAKREASFYVQLSCHPHIVRTFGLVQSNPGSIMLLQESAPHGDLSELLRENGFKPNESVLWEIFNQICDAMICLADNGIVHGDLACRNVLVFQSNSTEPKENLVKLTDFGLTRNSAVYTMVDSPVLTTMTIIPVRYVAPEILRNPDKFSYSEKSDVYSMGVLMWEACSYGQLPYSEFESDETVRKRKLNDKRLPQPSLCSDRSWKIMNECWLQDPLNRPTFKTLRHLLPTLQIESKFEQEARSSSRVNHNSAQSPTNEYNSPDDIVLIPCEYCDDLVDMSIWSLHTEACREEEQKRLENRRQEISQTPIIAQIPCDFCKKLFSVDQLTAHEKSCSKSHDHKSFEPEQPHSRIFKRIVPRAQNGGSHTDGATPVSSRKSNKTFDNNLPPPPWTVDRNTEQAFQIPNNDLSYPPWRANRNARQSKRIPNNDLPPPPWAVNENSEQAFQIPDNDLSPPPWIVDGNTEQPYQIPNNDLSPPLWRANRNTRQPKRIPNNDLSLPPWAVNGNNEQAFQIPDNDLSPPPWTVDGNSEQPYQIPNNDIPPPPWRANRNIRQSKRIPDNDLPPPPWAVNGNSQQAFQIPDNDLSPPPWTVDGNSEQPYQIPNNDIPPPPWRANRNTRQSKRIPDNDLPPPPWTVDGNTEQLYQIPNNDLSPPPWIVGGNSEQPYQIPNNDLPPPPWTVDRNTEQVFQIPNNDLLPPPWRANRNTRQSKRIPNNDIPPPPWTVDRNTEQAFQIPNNDLLPPPWTVDGHSEQPYQIPNNDIPPPPWRANRNTRQSKRIPNNDISPPPWIADRNTRQSK